MVRTQLSLHLRFILILRPYWKKADSYENNPKKYFTMGATKLTSCRFSIQIKQAYDDEKYSLFNAVKGFFSKKFIYRKMKNKT